MAKLTLEVVSRGLIFVVLLEPLQGLSEKLLALTRYVDGHSMPKQKSYSSVCPIMFSMHRQLTLDGNTTLIDDIKVLPKNNGEIYRLWAGGDRWGCRKCNRTDDRFGMLEHICKRNIK